MVEWLSGDPLVGVLTTIFFFTFLLIGRSVRLRQMRRRDKCTRHTSALLT
jgi:hypothetical protein